MDHREYYVDALRGDDAASGTREFPWRSLSKVNSRRFDAGDRVFLRGGITHSGSLLFTHGHGTPEAPIIVSSYGDGHARIDAGAHGGILLRNTGGFIISGIDIIGAGFPANDAHGICLYADSDGVSKWGPVFIEDVDISGFGCAGVAIGGKGQHGFQGVYLRGIRAHHNAYAGIFSWGGGQDYSHRDISIKDCVVDSNAGIPGLVHPSGHGIHSGHGILLSCVDGGVIEDCRAHDNGYQNTAHASGPAGIWASNSRRIVMRQNESFRNRTASATDGGGFGLDGGVTESVMEDNFSHDNDGPGFLLAQYYGARTFSGNRILRNRSENDARSNDNGAIHLWGPADDPLRDVLIEHNVVKLSPSKRGRPRAVFIGGRTVNLRMIDNKFNGASVPVLIEVEPMQRDMICRGNVFAYESGAVLWQGRYFPHLAQWEQSVPQLIA